jgi:SulP family sulfate permease
MKPRLPVATALVDLAREGYDGRKLVADLLAAFVVSVVALPLSMALALACGVRPEHGIYTAIVAGAVAALAGGSRFQVTGPTAAFVVVLVPVIRDHGFRGLMIATGLAGIMLIGLGAARLGELVSFIPLPVVAGFTAGIGAVIAALQLPDLVGVSGAAGGLPERLAHLLRPGTQPHVPDLLVGAGSLIALASLNGRPMKVPSPLIVLSVVTAVTWALELRGVASFETIADRFGALPAAPPTFAAPWAGAGAASGAWAEVNALLPAAIAIAVLGAIESLLSAVIADGMTGTRHDPNAELVGQGLANVAASFFGGFAATGALARTATNIRSGGRTNLAAAFHALFLLVFMLTLAPILGRLPTAGLAALLVVVAWNLADVRHVAHILRLAPRSDQLVLVIVLVLTVAFDMVVAVSTGVVLASFLFMKRMASLASVRRREGPSESRGSGVHAGILVYEIEGPLFFGAAERALGALGVVDSRVRGVVLDLSKVPTIDATGLVNLDSALSKLRSRGLPVVLAGMGPHLLAVLSKSAGSMLAGVEQAATIEDAVGRLTEAQSRLATVD